MHREATPLAKYLKGQEVLGELESRENDFTIARDKAVQKLAKFSLPEPSYWLLKLVQACIVSRRVGYIQILLGAKETEIRLEGLQPIFDLHELDRGLSDPSFKTSPGVQELITALRSVGFGERRGFLYCCGPTKQVLNYDTEELHRGPLSFEIEYQANLTVSTLAADESYGFMGFSGGRSVAARNADALQALVQRAHTCPIPLEVDGRRLDSLAFSPQHGWGPTSQLMSVGFCQGNLPSLWFPATGNRVRMQHAVPDRFLESATREMRETVQSEHSLAYLINANKKFVRINKDQSAWRDSKGPSVLYWVTDGVIVSQKRLRVSEGLMSLGVFVSGNGLDTDLTGFELLQSPEKDRRLQEAARLLSELARDLRSVDLHKFNEVVEAETTKTATALAAIGAGVSFLFVPIGIMCFVGASGLYAGRKWFGRNRAEKERYLQGLRALADSLESLPERAT